MIRQDILDLFRLKWPGSWPDYTNSSLTTRAASTPVNF
jgi:hypothetical protein